MSSIAQLKTFIAVASARLAATQPRSFQVGSAKVVFAASLLATVLTLSAGNLIAADPLWVDLSTWTPPEIGSVGDDPFGELVKYGRALFTDTANQIGPTVADPAKRYAGNNLSCQSCHLQGGTQPYAMPLVGVWGQFPQYRRREGAVGTLEDRINGCMERSMNGRALPWPAGK